MWVGVCVFTFFLPQLETPKSAENLTWHERLGLDALTLLRNPDHRVVFIVIALFAIPLTGFYPYAPPQLRELGFKHTSAWMSLGQVTEIISMLAIGAMMTGLRLKWIFATGLGFGLLRFLLSALNNKFGVLAGVILHGASFTLVFITAQIYLEQRVDTAWRARAQALMALVNGGVGNLIGYLGVGAWFTSCTGTGGTRWSLFWSGLALTVAAVLVYFLSAYRGRIERTSAKPSVTN